MPKNGTKKKNVKPNGKVRSLYLYNDTKDIVDPHCQTTGISFTKFANRAMVEKITRDNPKKN